MSIWTKQGPSDVMRSRTYGSVLDRVIYCSKTTDAGVGRNVVSYSWARKPVGQHHQHNHTFPLATPVCVWVMDDPPVGGQGR